MKEELLLPYGTSKQTEYLWKDNILLGVASGSVVGAGIDEIYTKKIILKKEYIIPAVYWVKGSMTSRGLTNTQTVLLL